MFFGTKLKTTEKSGRGGKSTGSSFRQKPVEWDEQGK